MENALVSLVLRELYDLAKDELRLLTDVEKELEQLFRTFTAIQAVLEDAERQQVTKKGVRDWLGKLKEVAYEVEDILDEWRTDTFRSQRDKVDIHIHKKVRPYLLFPCICFKKVESRHDTGHKIREITERLNKISIEKSAFNFNEGNTWEGKSSSDREQRQTGSLIDKTKIFVRDQDKESIVNELVCANGQEEKPFSIVSIVGMGGLGKTTLAKLVCNDERVIKHFKKIIWVYVSDRFDLNPIAKKIILSMSGSSCENLDFDTLQHSLHEVVGKMQFLLVLDDVWNENHSEWEKLKVPLNGAAQGSRIVVTTRSRKVAEVMEATHIHNLGILPDLDCWKLFTYEAFKGREEEKCQELTEVGMEIVDKCKGVPLAVVTVGSLLRHEKKTLDWKFILESEIWEWKTSKDEGMLPALLLSYYKLPLHLKPCFLFCSVFPKDHDIKKDELVKLWMAHGIIKSERAETEEIGEKYFDDLLTRSLFQDAQEDDSGNIIQCKMHDLVHDLAKFVTNSDYCIKEIGNLNLCSDSSHHLSLLVNYDASIIPSLMCKRLRTLLLFGPSRIKEVHDSLFNHLRFLRALDLSRTSIEKLPSSIGKLKHLRYLSLCGAQIVELPEFISELCNLQTLKLNDCGRLCILPSGISKMIKLRHLEIELTHDLTFFPNGLGKLTSLRTLCKFLVGDGNKGCKIGELKNLNLLRGNLEIQNLERVMTLNEATEAELDKKCYLHSLSLHCEYKMDEKWIMLGNDEMERMESVFEGLRPPHFYLRQLQILNYAGSKFPSWLEDSVFSSLVDVELKDCKKCKLLPGLGKLHALKYLKIYGADDVRAVGSEFYGNGDDRVKGNVFPRLEQLYFHSMLNWEEWRLTEECGQVMPSLSQLSIFNCHKLKALPSYLPNSLRKVVIGTCGEVIWMPCNPLPILEDLSLRGNVGGIFSKPIPCLFALKTLEILETFHESLPSDGWGLLESLHTLNICRCSALTSLPDGLGQLKALQTLVISQCSQLTSLPEGLGQLEALQTIRINYCYGLTSLLNGLGQFKALRNLYISTCTKLRSLSDGLVQLEALETVNVSTCTELRSLFDELEQLKSLRSLNIFYCSELRQLPKLQHLTILEELKMAGSPLVTEQFDKEKREDWGNISHIPCIEIDHQRIQ
ncbi:hypothetical protein MRB53_026536 [Persea americana]|uniref:Uncharacterized protein n=1 Tax=Persea americana TaxID=3435 RepID=A0ACC2LIW1_PERAE|nr:hypothetical protein MRB53_026536 [Persea americana]